MVRNGIAKQNWWSESTRLCGFVVGISTKQRLHFQLGGDPLRKIYKTVKTCERILALAWYLGILAIYILALIQAFSLELTETVGIILILWPFIMAFSVRMEKENLLRSIPVLQAHKIEGWGLLSFPAAWQAVGKETLVLKEAENIPCAVVFRKEQLQSIFAFDLPDHTPITVKVRHNRKSEAVSRCRYIVGEKKGVGYFHAVRHVDSYLISVVFCGNRIGKYVAEQILDEVEDGL